MKRLIIFLLFISFLLIPSIADAASARRTATNENVSTYDTSGKDYNSVTTWEQATDIDLVGGSQSEVLECYRGAHDDRVYYINGATTSSSYFRIVRPASGEGHSGIPVIDGTGPTVAFVTSSANYYEHRVDENNFQLQDIVFKQTSTGSTDGGVVFVRDCTDVGIIGCMVIDSSSNGSFAGFYAEGVTDAVFVDCLSHNNNDDGFWNYSGTSYYYNCTADSNSSDGFYRQAGTMTASNCASSNNTSADWNGTIGKTTCTTEGQTPTYVDSGSNNFQPASGDTILKDNGTDDPGSGVYSFDDDVVKTVWSSTWDIGFWEAASITTYYMRADGTAANKAAASGPCGTQANCMSIATHDGETFSAGDTIILCDDGGIYRDIMDIPSSGSSGNVITYQNASGDSPVISGADDISTAGWADQTGNVWRHVIGATEPNIVIFDGVLGIIDATPDAQYEWTYTNPNLDVYSTSDPDSQAYYTLIEAGVRSKVIDTQDESWITFDGLTVQGANSITWSDAAFHVGYDTVVGVVIQNCTIELNAYTAIDILGDVTSTSFTIDNNAIQNNGGFGVIIDVLFDEGTISNNTITTNGWGSVRDTSQYSGIQGQLGDLNIYKNNIYDNVTIATGTNTNHGIYNSSTTQAAATAVVNIYQNAIYDHANGDGIKIIGSANVYHNRIYGNATSGIQTGNNNALNVVYVIYENLIYDNNSLNEARGIVEQAKGAGTLSISIYNNTLYKNGNTTTEEIAIGDDVDVLNIKNNVLWASDTRRTLGVMTTQNGTVDVDYNLHWRTDGNPNIRWDASYPTWSEYQALGHDTNGVNVNPLFNNAGAGDFTLQVASPAIDTGVNLGATYDDSLHPDSVWPASVIIADQDDYGTGWEIGAYVFPGTLIPKIRWH